MRCMDDTEWSQLFKPTSITSVMEYDFIPCSIKTWSSLIHPPGSHLRSSGHTHFEISIRPRWQFAWRTDLTRFIWTGKIELIESTKLSNDFHLTTWIPYIITLVWSAFTHFVFDISTLVHLEHWYFHSASHNNLRPMCMIPYLEENGLVWIPRIGGHVILIFRPWAFQAWARIEVICQIICTDSATRYCEMGSHPAFSSNTTGLPPTSMWVFACSRWEPSISVPENHC